MRLSLHNLRLDSHGDLICVAEQVIVDQVLAIGQTFSVSGPGCVRVPI